MVTEYVAQGYEQNAAVAEEATSFLSKEGRRLKLKLEETEKALQEFRDASKSVSLEERNDIVNARLKELNAKLTEASSSALRLKTEVAQVDRLGTNVEALLVLPAVNADASVAQAKSFLTKLDSDFASLKQRYKEGHPKYIQVASEIETWRTTLTNAVLKVPQSFRSALESATAAQQAMQEELTKQEELSRQLTKQVTPGAEQLFHPQTGAHVVDVFFVAPQPAAILQDAHRWKCQWRAGDPPIRQSVAQVDKRCTGH